MLRWARKQGVEVGIFCALHTYGRQLNQHPHIHLSVIPGVGDFLVVRDEG
ncbi:transposase (plasmid) [Klebsiella oxytoca]